MLKLQCARGSFEAKQERLKRWKGSGNVVINGKTSRYGRAGRVWERTRGCERDGELWSDEDMTHKLTHILVNRLKEQLIQYEGRGFGTVFKEDFALSSTIQFLGKYNGMTHFSERRCWYMLAVYLRMPSGVAAQRKLLEITYWTADIRFIFMAMIYETVRGNSPTGLLNEESFIHIRNTHTSADTPM